MMLLFRPFQKPRICTKISFLAVSFAALGSFLAHAQDAPNRGRKYVPPPPTAHVSVLVVKDVNGKPIENAAVIFHMVGEEGKGNMELKTNEEGKAAIDVVPLGDTMTLQIIANGFQTFGEDYKIITDTKDIVVRLKRPAQQYSTYEHAAEHAAADSGAQSGGAQANDPKSSGTQPAPK
jgi:hypothetical protein